MYSLYPAKLSFKCKVIIKLSLSIDGPQNFATQSLTLQTVLSEVLN